MAKHTYDRFAAYGGRFGPGKVHKIVFDRLNRDYVTLCGTAMHHGEYLKTGESPGHVVTCKKCGAS